MAMAGAAGHYPYLPCWTDSTAEELPALHAPSSHSVPVMAAAFWSVPGRSDLGPFS